MKKIINASHTPLLLLSVVFLLYPSQVSAGSNLSYALEFVSIPQHMQLELLETFLHAEDTFDLLQTQNITDYQLQHYISQMHSLIETLDFSRIIFSIKTKYSTSKDANRQRLESLIYPLQQKHEPRMIDYNSFQELSRLFNDRVSFLQRLQQFYFFVQQEVENNKDNSGIIQPSEEELLAQAHDHYNFYKYDSVLAILLTIKTTIDKRALAILADASSLITQASQNQLPTQFLRDIFASAENELSVAYYEHILNQTTDQNERVFLLARIKNIQRTPGDEYTSIDYRAVQSLVQQINTTVIQIYRINATSVSLQFKLDQYALEGLNITDSQKAYQEALLSFQEERFDEAESLFSQAQSSLELHRVQAAITGVIAKEGIGFIKTHRWTFIFLIFFFVLSGPPLFRLIRLLIVDRRITTLKLESTVLIELVKKAQRERYEQGIIDHPTYNAKMDKYMERLTQVNTDLPVQKDIRQRFEAPTKIEMGYLFFKKHIFKLIRTRKR